MPMTISVGLSKKVGTANFGSVGASCNVSFEAGHDLLESDLAAFHRKVRNAFVVCRQAVQDELTRHHTQAGDNGTDDDVPTALATTASDGSGHRNGNGHLASEKQMTFARQLAGQVKGLGVRRLESLAEKMFSKPLVSLSSMDASGLIDALKSIKSGEVDLAAVFSRDAS